MGIQMLEEMLNLIRDVGDVKSVRMLDEDFILIEGDADDGKKFNFSLRIEEKKDV